MDLINQYLENLKTAALANPIEFLAVAVTIVAGICAIALHFTIGLGKFFSFFRSKPAEAKPEGFNEAQLPFDPDKPVLQISLDQYEARLKTREDELRAELKAAHADEKAILQA